jgi:hypothetical protein
MSLAVFTDPGRLVSCSFTEFGPIAVAVAARERPIVTSTASGDHVTDPPTTTTTTTPPMMFEPGCFAWRGGFSHLAPRCHAICVKMER